MRKRCFRLSVSLWSSFVEEVSEATCRLASLMECDSSYISLAIVATDWLVELRLVMVELRVLIKSESCSVSLNCSDVVALIKSHSCFRLLVTDQLSVESCFNIAEVIYFCCDIYIQFVNY